VSLVSVVVVVLGAGERATFIAHAKKTPDFARVLAAILASGVTRADERKIIADLVNLESATSDTQPVTAQPDEAQAASTLDT